MGIGIRTIRNFVPQVLAESEQVVEEAPTASPRQRTRRKAVEVPVMQDEVLGVRYRDFGHLPPEVWNHVVVAVRDGFRSFCRVIDETYAAGVEESLGLLLDIPTLDFFHAAEHVADLARELFGPQTTAAETWSKATRDLLEDEALDEFFAELQRQRQHALDGGDTPRAEAVQAKIDYFSERRSMLNYKQCRERGLPIGSGMVEGGIRFVGKDRLHRTGMRWGIPGAEAILQLRSTEASRERDTFSQRQATKRLQGYQASKTAWLRAA